MRGTPKAYEMLLASPEKPNVDTLYFISEADSSNAVLYLGEKLIAGGGGAAGEISLSNLTDISLSTDLADKSILVYDTASGKWVDSTLEQAISVFIGASANAAGKTGLVPAPGYGETNKFLRSDGTWASIDSSEATIITIENEDSEVMHQELIDQTTQGWLPCAGDIIIIKDIIINDKWQYTSYVYNGSTWAAMDGNYNAENVYFDSDFTFTTPVGTVTIPSTGSKVVDAAGMNIKDFLASIFAEEQNPTTTKPSIAFTKPSSDASYEVGTKVTPEYALSFNSGSYTYNTSTGVTATGWNVSDGTTTRTTQSGTMEEIQVIDNMNYKMTATATYSDGIIPSTNLGKEYADGQIKAGTTSSKTSKSITGYRQCFAGGDSTGSELTSAFIRENLAGKGNGASNRTITWAASDLAGMKRYIIALPVSGGKSVKSAIITSSMNADATADYVKQTATVEVEGANGYTAVDYNIWIYAPASIASTEVHSVTIG